jgi:hypothetical protein
MVVKVTAMLLPHNPSAKRSPSHHPSRFFLARLHSCCGHLQRWWIDAFDPSKATPASISTRFDGLTGGMPAVCSRPRITKAPDVFYFNSLFLKAKYCPLWHQPPPASRDFTSCKRFSRSLDRVAVAAAVCPPSSTPDVKLRLTGNARFAQFLSLILDHATTNQHTRSQYAP